MYRSLWRADHSSRGVLPTEVRRCVWSRNLGNEEALAHWGLWHQKQKYYFYILFCFVYRFFLCILLSLSHFCTSLPITATGRKPKCCKQISSSSSLSIRKVIAEKPEDWYHCYCKGWNMSIIVWGQYSKNEAGEQVKKVTVWCHECRTVLGPRETCEYCPCACPG
jgi:hypothetical protein